MKRILLLAVLFPCLCSANVIISATRSIYPSDKKEISVQLLNDGDSPSLVQAWIDDGEPDSTPETAKVPFLLMPPVVKVPAHSGQQLRVKYIGGKLPSDRESVFYLNVLDIPPVPENLEGKSIMQLAIRSRIKLFFRPVGLKISPKDMIDKLTLTREGKGITVHNASPYYLTLSSIRINKTDNILKQGLMIDPFSQKTIENTKSSSSENSVSFIYINDYGASIESRKKIQ
ncbi:molecular chaperone [Erwinia sp. AnSW2-5]|uniref:fimbrial biogenesis chaperone n=1 Tax=Erwinia sp. AnSW2-5 TaxID=3367692 RepID=UPI0038581C3E